MFFALSDIRPVQRFVEGFWVSLTSTICHRASATTAVHELSPVCAVLGGMLAQDILKALAAREPPIANFFTFDGSTGGGAVVRMGMP